MVVRDQERRGADAADVFLAFQHELRLAAVRVDMPGAWRGEAGHAFHARDLGHEFAPFQLFLQQAARRFRQGVDAVDPCHFLAIAQHQRNAFVGRLDGEGAHGRHAFKDLAVRVRHHQLAEGVAA
ncbi:hypothetical protein D3C72_2002120 [compost metagenome]